MRIVNLFAAGALLPRIVRPGAAILNPLHMPLIEGVHTPH